MAVVAECGARHLTLAIAYTYRSDYLAGLDRSFAQHEAASGNLAASLNYKISDNITLTFDALNLNNPTLKYCGDNKDQPRAFYSSGRQYYFGLRAKIQTSGLTAYFGKTIKRP